VSKVVFPEKQALKAICPNCGAKGVVFVDGELGSLGALISLSVDFLLLGPLVILGFFGHEPAETKCPNCGHSYHVRLNMRLQTYGSPSYFYSLFVYAILAAALLFLLFGVW